MRCEKSAAGSGQKARRRSLNNTDCATYRDLRELLAREDIDAVLIATGPNWHCTAATLAAKAGKDVYCEKPCTKNIIQSLQLRDVFRRTGRVFQAGTQRRSLPNFMFAIDLARFGKLGRLHTVYAHPAGLETKISGWLPAEPEPDKEEVDWDMYLGPAEWRPYNRRLLDGFNFEKGGGFFGAFGGGGCRNGDRTASTCANGQTTPTTQRPLKYRTEERTIARRLSQWREADHAQRRLVAAWLLPRSI